MRKILPILAIIGVCLFAFSSDNMAQTPEKINVFVSWEPPTSGSPVSFYILQLNAEDTEFITVANPTQPNAVLELDILTTYTARVSAVDRLGRESVFSEPSDPYMYDPGIPSAPGKPVFTIQ